MVIELSGVQFGLKLYAWFQNWTSAQREFDLKSQVWFQTKIARPEVQLPRPARKHLKDRLEDQNEEEDREEWREN